MSSNNVNRNKSHSSICDTLEPTGDGEADAYRSAKKEWDNRYRFFSRPFNLSNHACGSFESVRMKQYFDHIYTNAENPEIYPEELKGSPSGTHAGFQRAMSKRVKSCGDLVELSRTRAAENGSHSWGYQWPKYKYFSSILK